MEQRISLITLATRDLARSTQFYEAFGWQRAMRNAAGVSFFQCGCMALALYPAQSLAEDAGLGGTGSGTGHITLAYNTRDRDEVDATLAAAQAHGGTIVQAAQETFWGGYAGYFADPDDHLWEVAWNPGFPMDAQGAIQLPE